MTAFNVVRFRVRPGREQEFIAAHRSASASGFAGARRFALVKTGDNSYCVIGEWDSFNHIVDARPLMISLLDTFRDCLEDLGGGLGSTDPISGEALFETQAAAAKPRRAAGTRRKATAKTRSSAAKSGSKTAAQKRRRKPGKKTAARGKSRRR
jgi:antibiotic biosynthesis monooxygenase